MKIIAVADIHERLPDFNGEQADVLVIAGDICLKPRNDYLQQAHFINRVFTPWCERMLDQFNNILVVAGNHDVVFETRPELIQFSGAWQYLQDEEFILDGVKFWGTPWTIPFFNWGFNGRDEVRRAAFNLIPEDVDVIISHGPPRVGKVDVVCNIYNDYKEEFKGDPELSDAIQRTQPAFVFCGHLHDGHQQIANIGVSEIVNCSHVDDNYQVWSSDPWQIRNL